jgi:alkane 1-monooxygenase
MPGWVLWPAALAAGLHAVFGPAAAIMYAIGGAGGIYFLEAVNYVEHYGLSRGRLVNGSYERVSVGHAWNANHMLSNAVLLRLQRHSDHHMHGHRPYYTLNHLEGAPKLPASYSTMILLAMVPPAWFCVMNPRVHMHRVLADVQRNAGSQAPDYGSEPPLDTAVLA